MKLLSSFVLAASLLTLIAPMISVATEATPAVTPECQTFVSETLPKLGWKGDFVTVPEDIRQPKGRQIKVLYYYDASRDLKTAQPILFLGGGPLISYKGRVQAINDLVQKYDKNKSFVFVMMDFRGTGCSAAGIPTTVESDSRNALMGSKGVVSDAEAIRNQLFADKKWRIFSLSFGGYTMMRYLDVNPESVEDLHAFSPMVSDNMTEFFIHRILGMNRLLTPFFERYKTLNLERAFAKIQDPIEGSKFCASPAIGYAVVCGKVLLEGILGAIIQGPGRSLGSTEVWDGIKDSLMLVINDQAEAFQKAAVSGIGFFASTDYIPNSMIWAQETKMVNGFAGSDCKKALNIIRTRYGIQEEMLLTNHCQLVLQIVKDEYQVRLKEAYKQRKSKPLTQSRFMKNVKQRPTAKLYVYTAEYDSLPASAISTIISDERTNHTHLTTSGLAGWLFEPLVWERLMTK